MIHKFWINIFIKIKYKIYNIYCVKTNSKYLYLSMGNIKLKLIQLLDLIYFYKKIIIITYIRIYNDSLFMFNYFKII